MVTITKDKFYETMLLFSIAGMMFCVIPVWGMPHRLSWQLVSIWLACAAAAALLSSWWWRLFLILALARTATHIPPAYDEYISLLMVVIFLLCAEGFSRIDRERTMDIMCIAALIVLDWMALQKMGIVPTYFGTPGGIFNPDTAGIFLALCLPACARGWSHKYNFMRDYRLFVLPRWRREWRYATGILILPGIAMAWTSTAALAVLAGMGTWAYLKFDRKTFFRAAGIVIICAGIWFLQVKSIDRFVNDARWVAWKHAAWSLRSEAFGRGLGTWELVFPLLVSGEPRLGKVTNENGFMVMEHVFAQAHNEYVQATFEMGVQALALLLAFTAYIGWMITKRRASPLPAAGVVILIVSCCGFFPMHIAPTALLGCAWLGMWQGTAPINSPYPLQRGITRKGNR